MSLHRAVQQCTAGAEHDDRGVVKRPACGSEPGVSSEFGLKESVETECFAVQKLDCIVFVFQDLSLNLPTPLKNNVCINCLSYSNIALDLLITNEE